MDEGNGDQKIEVPFTNRETLIISVQESCHIVDALCCFKKYVRPSNAAQNCSSPVAVFLADILIIHPKT